MSNPDYEDRPLDFIWRPLSLTQIAEAFKRSSDGGSTVILSRLGITNIDPFEAKELVHGGQLESHGTESIVERLALGNNRLKTLPPEFAYFTRLRYLNLKHNSFAAFPEVLNLIPSLDTLDLSHNKIKNFPSDPGNLVRLRVLCLSRNKITRLPHYITQFQNLEVLQIDRNPWEWPPMRVIEKLTDIQRNHSGGDWLQNLYAWIETDGQKAQYDDSGYVDQSGWDHEPLWQFPLRRGSIDPGPTPHARSFSIDSNTSTSSLTESLHDLDINERIVPAPTDYIRMSAPEQTDEIAVDTFYAHSLPLQEETFETNQKHYRTQSHAGGVLRLQHPIVFGKKSLPDLRTARKELPRTIPPSSEENVQTASADTLQAPHSPSFSSSQRDSTFFAGPFSASFDDYQLSAADVISAEKNAYFRRSSSLTMSHALPKPLCCLLESARGILFAAGQLYQLLETYQDADESLSPVFKKVVEPASVSLLHLIRSLDRFDDVSHQKAVPPPPVCHRLTESCRDAIVAFRKALDLIASHGNLYTADSRYARWFILELYGISVEISSSWKILAPEVDYLKPFLYTAAFPSIPLRTEAESDIATTSDLLAHEGVAPVLRPRPADSHHYGVSTGRLRTARRHAGSFSSKDVEIGKDLPSHEILPIMIGGIAPNTPILRAPKRLMTLPTTQHPSNLLPFHSNPATVTESGHLRDASQGLNPSSQEYKYALVDCPTSTPLNSEVIRAIQTTINLTSVVCDQVEIALGDKMSANRTVAGSIDSARTQAKKLSDILRGDPEKTDWRTLREDAHMFLKVILQLSNTIQAQSNLRSISTAIESNVLKLTSCTEEFSILLHIAPGGLNTLSPGSPISLGGSTAFGVSAQPMEDNALASFFRSRSVQVKQPNSKPIYSDNSPAASFVPVKPLNPRRLPTKDSFKMDPG